MSQWGRNGILGDDWGPMGEEKGWEEISESLTAPGSRFLGVELGVPVQTSCPGEAGACW